MTDPAMPAPLTTADIQRLVSRQLSMASRVGHVALLLAALAALGITGSLWATEGQLPLRTHIAFGGLAVVAVSWVVYASWVLTTRRVLLATHRLVAARMGLVFSVAFVAGALAVAVLTPAAAALNAAAFGSVMCLAAAGLMRQARVRVKALQSRRAELERALSR